MAIKKTALRSTGSSKAIAKLTDELHGYHIEVVRALATMQANCTHCHERVEGLDLQINGEKPEKDDAPSMKHDIASLKQSRDSQKKMVHYTWAVLTGIGSLIIALFSYKPWKA